MIRNYQIIEKIGKGTFGIVYKVKRFNDPLIYVIKQISLNGLTDIQINQVYSEAKILSLIKSRYVVKYYESFLENDNLNIVMEYCDNGDLCNYLNEQKMKSKPLKEDLIWKIFIKITLGLTTIHKMKILHRDLKTLNIFLKKDMEIKIGDLGVAKELNQASFANTIIGTPYYLSPEMCQDQPYNQKSDVWALGVILYELCTFRHPFNAGNHAALILKILTVNPDPILACYSSNLQKLVNLILEKNIDKRPNCWDLLNMPIVIQKAKGFGLYQEIIKVYSNNDNNNNDLYYVNHINNNKEQMNNIIPMDSEDILIQSQLVPLANKNNLIQVKKLNNGEKRNLKEKNNGYINNNMNQINTRTNNNDFINNYNNIAYTNENQFPYNYSDESSNIYYNNINIPNGNYIMYNNNNYTNYNYNNLNNNNFNPSNNIIYNNILINNNTITTNDSSFINNNNEPNNSKVIRVHQRPIKIKNFKKEEKNFDKNFIEDKQINDISDSLNISVQVVPIDMDRISSEKIKNSINSSENNKIEESTNENYYNYPLNSDVPLDNSNEDEYPKDNTRNQNTKINMKINEEQSNKKKEESPMKDEKEIKDDLLNMHNNDFSNEQKKSLNKSNSYINKKVSHDDLIINTQESIDIMDRINNLNINNNSDNQNFIEKPKKERKKNSKKKLNLANMLYKKKNKENIINKEKREEKIDDDIKKFNKTSINLSSSGNFNINYDPQDATPLKNHLYSNNNLIKNIQSPESESDSDFYLLKSSDNDNENDINDIENNKIYEQNIPSLNVDEKENDNDNDKDERGSLENNEDVDSLKKKYKNIQNEIFDLIGEKYYSNIMDLIKKIKDKNILHKEIDKLLDKTNFTNIKKEKFFDLYLSLIYIESQLNNRKKSF